MEEGWRYYVTWAPIGSTYEIDDLCALESEYENWCELESEIYALILSSLARRDYFRKDSEAIWRRRIIPMLILLFDAIVADMVDDFGGLG